ncbi:hypothetical protein [Imbroritus primus]|uniref:hypothetical protein n=1 Tax=Imbroritus primus TaxID=3058603 RepID=UPI003D1612FF
MSRSRRKLPIFGFTTARSEAGDKRLWHKRWRSRQRDQLATLRPDDDPIPVQHRAVSDTWDMAKDGKSWFAPRRQRAAAERFADRRGESPPERKALKARLLAKWRSK